MSTSQPNAWNGDVLVVGGGPAGAVAARLLASRGHQVALVHGPGTTSGVAAETMVDGAHRLLERLDLIGTFESLGFRAQGMQGVAWTTPEVELRQSDGFRVDRELLDPALRSLAREAGVHVIEGQRLAGPLRAHRPIPLREDPSRTFEARVVVCATGRDTVDGLVEAPVRSNSAATLALSSGTLPVGDATNAIIEAVPEGWWWWIPRADGRASLTLMADRDEVRATGRDALWASARAHSDAMAKSLDVAPIHGVAAGGRLRETAGDEPVLLAGDAALTLDPLTSQGLERALASAVHTAHCVGTLLQGDESPPDVLAARRTFERDLDEVHAEGCALAYAQVERFADMPFWRARRFTPAPRPPRRNDAPPTHARLVRSPDLVPARALLPRGDVLVGTDGLAHRLEGSAISRIGPFPIEALLEVLGADGLDWMSAAEVAVASPRLMGAEQGQLAETYLHLWRRGYVVERPRAR